VIDLRKLRVFVQVAEAGSLTRAAGNLALAQSALSRKIRELEEELGFQLLHRNGRGVEVTEAGKQFLKRSKQLLLEADSLLSDMKELQTLSGGTVSLGLPPSVSHILLTGILARIKAEHPAINVRVVEGFSGHIQEWLLNGRIDIGILYATRRVPTLLGDELVSEDLYAIGPAGDAITSHEWISLADISVLPLVVPSRPHGLRILIDDAFSRCGHTPSIDVELDALATMKSLVESGVAYSILPYSTVAKEIAEGRLTGAHIIDPTVSRKLVLATANQRSASRATRDVAWIIRSQVAELIRLKRWGGAPTIKATCVTKGATRRVAAPEPVSV
jgi:LysR family nitrogen assimilation transcriptional regulator